MLRIAFSFFDFPLTSTNKCLVIFVRGSYWKMPSSRVPIQSTPLCNSFKIKILDIFLFEACRSTQVDNLVFLLKSWRPAPIVPIKISLVLNGANEVIMGEEKDLGSKLLLGWKLNNTWFLSYLFYSSAVQTEPKNPVTTNVNTLYVTISQSENIPRIWPYSGNRIVICIKNLIPSSVASHNCRWSAVSAKEWIISALTISSSLPSRKTLKVPSGISKFKPLKVQNHQHLQI